MDFTKRLKARRQTLGLTQYDLGDLIGVTPVTIGNWERGARQPSFDLLPKLAGALHTTIDSLIGYDIKPYESESEKHLIEKYRQLDVHGKRLVRIVCDEEYKRIAPVGDNTTIVTIEKPLKHNRYIPFYLTPPAAGISVPLEGDEFEMILADDSVPAEADYAVRISGDSMEPYIKNGSIVFVKEVSELNDGDIGIFCVDGAMYCKQYHIDDSKNLHLLSLNPERVDANVFVSKDSSASVKCCGKILLNELHA